KVRPEATDKPWSRTRQWSLVYLDEGGPSPVAGHTKLEWALTPDSFTEYYKSASLPVSVLTVDKLEHLLRRYNGEMDRQILLNNGNSAQRLNYSHLEQFDVLISLSEYAQISEEHKKYLQETYEKSTIKPFGSSINEYLLKKAVL
ncbi:MAG: hypothetical protein ACP5KS_09670, partial [Candidatus Hydrogenedens sp.]